jgi:hypothetical protein
MLIRSDRVISGGTLIRPTGVQREVRQNTVHSIRTTPVY